MSGHTQGFLTVPEQFNDQWAILGTPPAGWPHKNYAVAVGIRNGEDARRLAACWNKCNGMATENVEACPDGGLLHLAAFANEVVLQRDALVAAIKPLLEDYIEWVKSEKMESGCGEISRETIMAEFEPARNAAAAIAAATEPQAIAADLAYNQLKNTGELQRREADRALADQMKWGAP